MLYFKTENGRVVEISSETHFNDRSWEDRHDWKDMESAEAIAESATELTGELYIAVDGGRGRYPRFDVIEAPKVGDKVSYAFNGDYYPDGEIVKVSKTLKVVETDSGNRYYRKRKTGSWVMGGTWSMVPGHIDKRNPHF